MRSEGQLKKRVHFALNSVLRIPEQTGEDRIFRAIDEAKKEFPYYADLIIDIDNPQWKDMKGNWHDGFWSEVVIKWFKEQFGE